MAGQRFYLPPENWANPVLCGDEARHCRLVLRHEVGDCVTIFDGRGREARARIRQAGKESLVLEFLETTSTPPQPLRLTLGLCVLKGDAMLFAVEKATELGVSRIVPINSLRCVAKADPKNLGKWNRVALEACKQCGNNWLPEIGQPLRLAEFLSHESSSLRLFGSLADSAKTWSRLQATPSREAAVLIGPEGDFTPEESEEMIAAGWLAWSFATPTLRAETAAIHALSVLHHELINWVLRAI